MRNAAVLALSIAALCAVAAPGAACSLEREPPGPGYFYLWRVDEPPIPIPVENRGLAADCSLANPFAFDGTNLVWAERSSYDLPTGLLIAQPPDYQPRPLPMLGSVDGPFSVSGRYVWYVASGDDFASRFIRLDLDSGINRVVPAPTHVGSFGLHGSLALWTANGINAYDLLGGTWLWRNRTLESLGLPDDATMRAGGMPWSVFATGNATWALDASTDRARAVSIDPDTFAIISVGVDRGDAYYVWIEEDDFVFRRHDLGTDRVETIAFPPHPFTGVVDGGTFVLAEFSDPKLGGGVPMPLPILLAGAGVVAAGIFVFVAGARRHRDGAP